MEKECFKWSFQNMNKLEWLEVNTLEKTERGGDGFGSTGIK